MPARALVRLLQSVSSQKKLPALRSLEWDLALAEATAKELDPTGERVIAIRCNVADSEMVKAAVDQVVATFGRIDVLINNAGITRDKIFHKMTDDDWHMVIDVNLNGVYNLCKYVLPLMREQESGAVVNLSSTSVMGNPGQATTPLPRLLCRALPVPWLRSWAARTFV